MAYGLARNFIEPLKKYGASMFTSTIACALEYGQLPAEIVGDQGCAAAMNGKGGAGGGSGGGRGGSGSGGGSSGRGGSQGNNNQNGQDKNKNKNSKSGSSDSQSDNQGASDKGGSSASSEGDKSGSSANSGRRGRGGGGTTVVGANGQILKLADRSSGVESGDRPAQITIENASGGGSGGDPYQIGRVRQRKPIYKSVQGELVDEVAQAAKNEKKSEKTVSRSVASGGFENLKKNRRLEVGPQREKKVIEQKKEEWDLSKIVRTGLIILMIVAIVLFVFFQLAQMRKGSGSS